MEAVVFDGKTLSLSYQTNYPVPKIQNESDVIIKVEYSGICGTDVHIIQGEFPASKDHPLPLGHEFSGVIQEVGKTSSFKVGQRVVVDPNRSCSLCEFCRKGQYQHCATNGVDSVLGIWKDGGWAQYVVVPQDLGAYHKFFQAFSLHVRALCEPYSCVSHGFDRASPLSVNDKILIMGSGIIGHLWVTALHHHGHRDVTVSGRNMKKLEFFKNMDTGYRLITPDILAKEDELYDVIIDCTGSAEALSVSMNLMRPGGKYVVFGCCPTTHEATVHPFQIYVKELTIIGVKVNPFSFPNTIAWLKVMGNRYLEYEKLGIKTYALSEYEKAFHDVKSGEAAKAVFKL